MASTVAARGPVPRHGRRRPPLVPARRDPAGDARQPDRRPQARPRGGRPRAPAARRRGADARQRDRGRVAEGRRRQDHLHVPVGATLAARRGLRVVAVDADHDVGTLDLLVPENGPQRTARQALRDLDRIDSAAAARAVHGRAPERAARPRRARPARRLGPEASSRPATARSSRCSSASTTSCCSTSAPGFANPVARFALRRADQAIMVSGSDSSARRAWPRPARGCWTPQAPPACGPSTSRSSSTGCPDHDAATRLGSLLSVLPRARRAHRLALPEDRSSRPCSTTGTYSLGPLARGTRMAIRELALSTAQRLA